MQSTDDSILNWTLPHGACTFGEVLDFEVHQLCQDLIRKVWLFPTLQKLFQDELMRQVQLDGGAQQIKDYVTAATNAYEDFFLEDVYDHDAIVGIVPTASPSDLWKVRKEKLMLALGLSHMVTYHARHGEVSDLCEDVVKKLQRKVSNKHKIKANVVKTVLSLAQPMFKDMPNVLPVRRSRSTLNADTAQGDAKGQQVGKLTVVGDLHGQYEDLMNILTDPKLGGFPSDDNQILFNGDLVDRGNWSVEIMMMLLCIKIVRPNAVHILRGNHECTLMNESYGFHKDLDNDYEKADQLKRPFAELFNALPIAAVIEDAVFVTHGGLGATVDKMTIDAINKQINRFMEVPLSGPMHELLWSDPTDQKGKKSSRTGAQADMFTCDVTKAFLARNKLQLLLRSHQDCAEGFKKEHDDLCWTVFSAPNYCGQKGNLGAVIRFEGIDMTPAVVQFEAVHYSEHSQFIGNRKYARQCKHLLSVKASQKICAEVRDTGVRDTSVRDTDVSALVAVIMATIVGTVLGSIEGAV